MAAKYGRPKKTGGAKSSLEQRKKDNKGVKDGAVRVGAKGKQMRQYNAKTGRWELIKESYGSPRMASGKPAPKSNTKTSTVSPSKRGEGSQRALTKRNVEFARGIGSQRGMTENQKSKNLRDAKNKAAYDKSKRGQERNNEGISALMSIVGGAAGGAAARAAAVGARAGSARAIGSGAKAIAGKQAPKAIAGRKAITGRPAPKAITSGKNNKKGK